jgi:hypothetical protein
MNRLVARFTDGRMVKGAMLDFAPSKDVFHMTEETPVAGTSPVAIHAEDLKALFFVKDYAGDPLHVERKELDSAPPPGARSIRASFKDGEVLVGTTTGYQPGLPGFFLVPADPESNNLRCYLFAEATEEVGFL